MACNDSFGEGHSLNRPPLFKGDNYNYWKIRMNLFIKSLDYDLWKIVNHGDFIPKTIVDGISIPKTREDLTETDRRNLQLNAKALNLIFCSLDPENFNKVSGCDSAKEAWEKLRVTYEGTNQVKEAKISMLIHDYELFKMKSDESISDMFSRFTNIINGLKSLGKVYLNAENVRKLLRSLPKAWDAKVLAVEEAKDLTKFELDELLGSLMTHEMNMKSRAEKENDEKPKKVIALKSASPAHNLSDNSEGDEDHALMARNFRRFMRKKSFSQNPYKREEHKGEASRSTPIVCYECKKPGHIKTKCPKLGKDKEERYKGKKKAFKAQTWDDSDGSSSEKDSDDNETANLCFMAKEDEVISQSQTSSLENEKPSYEELEENFIALLNDFDSTRNKNKVFKKNSKKLVEEIDYLKSENFKLNEKVTSLISDLNILNESPLPIVDIENDKLRVQVKLLEKTLTQFTSSTKNLDLLLGNQRCVFDKAGLGFQPKEKMYKTFFSKSTSLNVCEHCGVLYIGSHTCPLKKTFLVNGKIVRKVWIPKGTKLTNH